MEKIKGRAFVVEDEALIFLNLKSTLGELGWEVASSATRIDSAQREAESGEFDIAILDLNLNGALTYPVADILKSRRIPFILTTGYSRTGIDGGYVDAPLLQKPFSKEDLDAAIRTALGQNA